MTQPAFTRILVAVDDSPAALAATRVAVQAAVETGARLLFMHVVADGGLARSLAQVGHTDELAARRQAAAESLLRHVHREAHRAGVRAETRHERGEPAALLLAAAREWGADLIVVGHSDVRTAGRPYVGAVTRHILEFAETPVLVVPRREPGAGSPEAPG